ncbi:hypothetical protein FGG08_006205 [Glutinoglossum americanum]|uniref:Protein kinase domain-containing protein n=1 Tax=Glutinoglossum americanum TaxID=1670608 RepID=A0A9P8L0N2_9PEZI|nr:hypothetical protein FGG08_006205 [Glutinoglossum americanum]
MEAIRPILLQELFETTPNPMSVISTVPSALPPKRLAKYQNELVFVEMKSYDAALAAQPSGSEIYKRVSEIALMLGSPQPGDLRVLRCRGWYEDIRSHHFCFVFHLPPESTVNVEPGWEERMTPKSLWAYILSDYLPSLTARIRLACLLAKSVYNIHATGWLHKGVRSENILFFPANPNAPRSLDSPRLAGFDFARRDGPNEHSEKPINTDTNLYRHPDALRDPTTRFTKIHEYYSLGIVLVEIAQWRPMRHIMRNHQNLQGVECKENDIKDVQGILLDINSEENYLGDVEFRMGTIYRGVVELCLRGNFGSGDLLAAFSEGVVAQLDRCVI